MYVQHRIMFFRRSIVLYSASSLTFGLHGICLASSAAPQRECGWRPRGGEPCGPELRTYGLGQGSRKFFGQVGRTYLGTLPTEVAAQKAVEQFMRSSGSQKRFVDRPKSRRAFDKSDFLWLYHVLQRMFVDCLPADLSGLRQLRGARRLCVRLGPPLGCRDDG